MIAALHRTELPQFDSNDAFTSSPFSLCESSIVTTTTTIKDRSSIRSYFENLSNESRRLRLHVLTNAIPESVLRLYDGRQTAHITGFVARDMKGDVLGEAILANSPSKFDSQIGISVSDTKRGCGIGALLMREMLDRAKLDGCQFLHADSLCENRSFINFATHYGFRRSKHPDDWHQIRLTRVL